MAFSERDHRDIKTAEGVRKMAEMRRFDQEFAAYGTLEYKPDGREMYHAGANEEQLLNNMERATYEGSFFTPLISLRERTPAPAGFDEILEQAAKYALLSKMKKVYGSSGYLEAIKPFYETPANDLAQPALEAYRRAIDGYFDERKNQLFLGGIQEAYKRKILTHESFNAFYEWYEDVTRQMEDIPVIGDAFARTFYGFVYVQAGSIRLFVDAKRSAAARVRAEKRRAGARVGAIMKKTCYFHTFAQIRDVKKQFGQWVTDACDASYLALLQALDDTPGVIDKNDLANTAARFAGQAEASAAFGYYQALWNGK